MQVCSTCWRENEHLLRSQGLDETSVQQVWAAVAGYVRANLVQGRGTNLPGICKLLQPRAKGSNPSGNGLSIVLSDKLLKRFPNLQLGNGMSHHAAVKDQVQGADDINHIRLAQRCPELSRDAVQLVLKTIVSTITRLIELQQSLVLDLGAGQLRFKAGRVVEFQSCGSSTTASSPSAATPVQQAAGAAATVGSGSSGGAGLTAEALSQLGVLGAGSGVCKSTVSKVSRLTESTAVAQTTAAGSRAALAAEPHLLTPSSEDTINSSSSSRSPSLRKPGELPSKPCSSPLSPNDVIEASRHAKAAAVANARVKPATFVLPVGAPGEQDAPQVPQGKGRPTAASNLAHQQVLEAAAKRHGMTEAAQAAAESELLARNEALRQVLDAQAQAMRQQKVANKKQLAETLAQQVREKQTLRSQDAAGGALMLGKTAAQVSTLRLKQQADYRAALDEQLAAKASLQQQRKVEDTHRALAELQQIQQSVVEAAEANRSNRQQAMALVRQQLDMQMLDDKHKSDVYW